MKYGESLFDILYLITVIVLGVLILSNGKDKASRLMGIAALTLGIGDSFHLVPRVLNYFVDADFTAYLGIGKLITSITMTAFYVLMYRIYVKVLDFAEEKALSYTLYVLAVIRVVLCLMPQNNWLKNDSSMLWGFLRNLPFAAIGAVIVWLYFAKRKENKALKNVWIYVTMSFLFYIPVTVGAGVIPVLGALMLPKTVCYVLIVCVFLKYSKQTEEN